MVLLHLQCPSGVPLRYTVCHTACSSFAFVRAATVSFTPLRSLLPSLRFIAPRSQLFICFMAGAAHKPSTNHYTGLHQPFASQRYNTHWVPFRFTTSFIHYSSVQSTRCLLFGSPAAHFGCVHLAIANCLFVPHFAKHR